MTHPLILRKQDSMKIPNFTKNILKRLSIDRTISMSSNDLYFYAVYIYPWLKMRPEHQTPQLSLPKEQETHCIPIGKQ